MAESEELCGTLVIWEFFKHFIRGEASRLNWRPWLPNILSDIDAMRYDQGSWTCVPARTPHTIAAWPQPWHIKHRALYLMGIRYVSSSLILCGPTLFVYRTLQRLVSHPASYSPHHCCDHGLGRPLLLRSDSEWSSKSKTIRLVL